jgi:hypothetical protein
MWIRKTISAKIEIVYGRWVQRWAEGNLRLSNLQLWGEYETIRLFFEWALRENDLEKVLRSPDDCECLPSHVELWCVKCKEKMVLKQSQSSGNGEEISEVARTALDPAPRH